MTAAELKAELQAGHALQLLDVREPSEYQIANIGGVLIPLGDLPTRHTELDPHTRTVVLCHHGVRSAHAVGYLRSLGFVDVHNLAGGIEAWSVQVDPTVPRY